jgi:hypothetical protein
MLVMRRGMGAVNPGAIQHATAVGPSPAVRRRNTDALVMLGSGLTGTLVTVLYAAEKHREAGIVGLVTGLLGMVYGTIRLLEDWETEPVDETETEETL